MYCVFQIAFIIFIDHSYIVQLLHRGNQRFVFSLAQPSSYWSDFLFNPVSKICYSNWDFFSDIWPFKLQSGAIFYSELIKNELNNYTCTTVNCITSANLLVLSYDIYMKTCDPYTKGSFHLWWWKRFWIFFSWQWAKPTQHRHHQHSLSLFVSRLIRKPNNTENVGFLLLFAVNPFICLVRNRHNGQDYIWFSLEYVCAWYWTRFSQINVNIRS